MYILRIILLITTDLDLLEPPLRQRIIRRPQITPRRLMPKPQPRRQRMDLLEMPLRSPLHIVHDLHDPIIVKIADRSISVRGHFVIELRDGRDDVVRVQVAGGGGMDETDDVAIFEEADLALGIDGGFVPFRGDDPVVVAVLVVVAGHLLLVRTDGISLDVRVQKAASPAHVLERQSGAEGHVYT